MAWVRDLARIGTAHVEQEQAGFVDVLPQVADGEVDSASLLFIQLDKAIRFHHLYPEDNRIRIEFVDRLHKELVRRARVRGQTLTDYLQEILEREVARPEPAEVDRAWLCRIFPRTRHGSGSKKFPWKRQVVDSIGELE